MDPQADDIIPALDLVRRVAGKHVCDLNSHRAATFSEPLPPIDLPRSGDGAVRAIELLLERFGDKFSGSPGPRYWGFVNGGVTPAALAGDWLCSAVDQNAQLNGDGAGAHIEHEAISMLGQLLDVPEHFYGTFVTGGTMSNFVGLGVALQRLGSLRGVDVSREGVSALRSVRIVTGESHSSIAKSAAMLGLGRDSIVHAGRLPQREAVDPDSVRRILREGPRDQPTIVVANAGTVLTGDFDDIATLADIAGGFGAHLHVDGAFGAFAACTKSHKRLVAGMSEADTIASDAHKFLNVPFDSGFVFAADLEDQVEMFKNVSSYQAPPAADPRHYIHLTPQNSRRLRAMPAWLTLQAYGAEGYATIVERCCMLAERLGMGLNRDHFRLLADVRYNIVCFGLRVHGRSASAVENRAFLDAVRDDGRVYVTPGELNGTPCVRLAIVNWQTSEEDIHIALEAFDDVHRKLFG